MPTDKGVAIDSPVGKLVLEYPKLGSGHKQTGVTIAGNTATVTYDGGAEVVVEVKADGTITIKPSNLPADVKQLATQMTISRGMAKKCKWSFNGGEAKAFPADKPAKPHLFQGGAATFALLDDEGAPGSGVMVTTPASYSYNELTDCREWNWDVVQWKVNTPINPDWKSYTYKVGKPGDSPPQEAAAAAPPERAEPAKPVAVVDPATSGGVEAKFAVTLGAQNIGLSLNSAQSLRMNYPNLYGNDNKAIKPHDISVSSDKKSASLKFPNGASATVTLEDHPSGGGGGGGGKQMGITFADVPESVKSFRLEMQIAFNFAQGGSYAIDQSAMQAFPTEKPAKPHLYQGNATSYSLAAPAGGGVKITVPQYTFLQLTDSREWNWKMFHWYAQVPLPQDGVKRNFQFAFSPLSGESAKPAVLVDKFGQPTKVDYPGKVKSIEELKQDVEDEKAYYASFNPPQLDAYGGLPGSGEKLGLTKTGFFHVQKVATPGFPGGRWVLVDPEGNAFFQLGICVFTRAAYTYVEGRESIYEWIPPVGGEFADARPEGYWNSSSVSFHLANMIRKFGPISAETFAQIMIDRVRAIGFNSAGAFSGSATPAHRERMFPYVLDIPHSEFGVGLKRIPGIRETWDPFSEQNVAKFEAACAKSVAARANDPLLIGYFLVNEPLYQDIPRVVPKLKGEWACKRRLVQMLQEKYDDIAAFNQAWKMQAASFDELNDQGLPVTTQAAADDLHDYTGLFLETYFKLVHDTMKKHDANHMLIGNRLQSGTANSKQLCEISGKYLDVFSLNYYTYGIDRSFVDRLYSWTGGKPMLLPEFHYNSIADSGLPGGAKDVATQNDRGLAYRHYVEHAASIPYVLGVQWFTLVDTSVTGQWFSKYGGENGNTGIISVADRPWKEAVAHMAQTNHGIYDVYLNGKKPFEFDDPRFKDKGAGQQMVVVTRVSSTMVIDGSSEGWPGMPATRIGSNRLVIGNPGSTSGGGDTEAAFRLAWDQDNLYILADVRDATPMMNQQSDKYLWQGDGVELFIGHEKLDQSGTLLFSDRHVILAANADGAFHWVGLADQPACRVAVVRSGEGYALEAAVPWTAIGVTPEPGRELLFDVAIDDSANGTRRDRQLMWNGIGRNSGDRTAWGKARLTSQ